LSPDKIAIVERAHRARADYIAGLAVSLIRAARRALLRLARTGDGFLRSRDAGREGVVGRRKRQ
jgi:hypothetical protein